MAKYHLVWVIFLTGFLTISARQYEAREQSERYFRVLLTMEDCATRLELWSAMTGHYPEKLSRNFYANPKDVGSLGYRLSADGQNWTLYCPGRQFGLLGLEENLPAWSYEGGLVGVPDLPHFGN